MTLEQLIRDNPELDDAGIVALANTPTISLKPALVRFRTLDMMFNAAECYQIETALTATITALLATPDDDPAVLAKRGMGSRLRRAQAYMQGTADSDGIDVGDASVRADVTAMVGTVLTEAQAAAILALGEIRTYVDGGPGITEADVAAMRTILRVAGLVDAETRHWYDLAQTVEGWLLRDELTNADGTPLPLATATAEQVREACKRVALEA